MAAASTEGVQGRTQHSEIVLDRASCLQEGTRNSVPGLNANCFGKGAP